MHKTEGIYFGEKERMYVCVCMYGRWGGGVIKSSIHYIRNSLIITYDASAALDFTGWNH